MSKGGRKPPQPFHRAAQRSAATDAIAGVRVVTMRADALPRPPKVYHANVASVSKQGSSFAFVFGERWPGEKRLASAICLYMPIKAVRGAVVESTPNFVNDLKAAVLGLQIYEPATELSSADYPSFDRRASEHASLMAIGYADQIASLRFYRLSAPEAHQLKTTGSGDAVVPNFEVVLPAGLLAGLLERSVELLPTEDVS